MNFSVFNTFRRPLLVLATVAAAALLLHVGREAPRQDPNGAVPFAPHDAEALFPQATGVMPRDDGLYDVVNADGARLGLVVHGPPAEARITGFAGGVPFLVGLDPRRRVTGVHLLPSQETASYAQRVSRRLHAAWNGLSLSDAVDQPVDHVTGATHTSRALIEGLRHTLRPLAEREAADVAEPASAPPPAAASVLTLLVLAGTLVLFFRPLAPARLRPVLNAVRVLVPGVLAATLLSLPVFASWLRGAATLRRHGLLVVIALPALAIPLITGRNFYCAAFCPFGAAQDLTGKLTRRKWRPGRRLARILGGARTVLLLAALTIVLVDAPLDLAVFEPFAAFRWPHAPCISRLLAACFLLAAVWTPRPWCRLCPTGGLIHALRRRREPRATR